MKIHYLKKRCLQSPKHEDYTHAPRVCKTIKLKSLEEYYDWRV